MIAYIARVRIAADCQMKTFEAVLAKNKGLGPGFDFLRVSLALSIVTFHAFLQTGNNWVRETPLWFLEYALVPMFFALSGFLVTASGQRLSLKNFLINRGLRITPALAVDIVFCALIIGPLVTHLDLKSYFSGPKFWLYFLNITGWIHYYLPGVFEDHVNRRVNGALWTVPYEMICYLFISGLIVFSALRSPRKVIVFTFGLIFLGSAYEHTKHFFSFPSAVDDTVTFLLTSRESQIVTAFLFGVIAFQLRRRIPYSLPVFLFCVAVCVTASLGLHEWQIYRATSRTILLPAITYITIYLGLTDIPLPGYFKKGDYSYGIYLYHDPILQLIITLFPVLCADTIRGVVFLFLLGVPAVLIFAAFSWHVVEKPVLSLRKKFSFVARVRGGADSEIPPPPPER
jgi:peptidoglycan/LPS O-acetylase OafA/YrhL